MGISVIIAAAGESRRMGISRSKILLPLLDRPVLAWSLELFQNDDRVDEIIVATSANNREAVERICERFSKAKVTQGGATRGISVTMSLAKVNSMCNKVAIHDAARPLISRGDWDALVKASEEYEAVVPLVHMTDSIKTMAGNTIVGSLPRETLAGVQTPQIFNFSTLLKAHRNALRNNVSATDDSQMVETMGVQIHGVFTKDPNSKITFQEDLLYAEMVLRMRQLKGQVGS